MLKLSDENLATLRSAAAPLSPWLRTRLLEDIAEACGGKSDLGGGEFHRIAHACAQRLLNGDDIDGRR
jgi:hypothetical protein